MVDKEYAALFNKLCLTARISKPTRKTIQSMGRLNNFKDLSFGEHNPSYRFSDYETPTGSVLVPKELSKLLSVVTDGDVYFYGDIRGNILDVDDVLKLDLRSNHFAINSVTVLYSPLYGIQELVFNARDPIACGVPHGFSIDDLVALLGSNIDVWGDFVLKYGKLTGGLREGIAARGLDGLKGRT